MQSVNTVYMKLLVSCYEDVASAYPAEYREEQRRDLTRLRERFTSEGVGFLTKTLPSLAKAVDTALATGTVLQVPSFGRKKGSKLPRFLGWLIGQVFSSDGVERLDASPLALRHIRQLLYLFYKLELPYAQEVVEDFLDDFKRVDAGLNDPVVTVLPGLGKLARKASQLISRALANCSPRDIVPGHGPGAVATGEQMEQKAYFKRLYADLEEYYPLDEYFFLNASHHSANLGANGLNTRCFKTGKLLPFEELEHSTAKVVLVPKDSRGPRLISMEPLEKQWIQQGQCRVLVKTLETHWLTRGHINFERQDINQSLALLASMAASGVVHDLDRVVNAMPHCSQPTSSDLVTIDMKEASDRVSLTLVQSLFPECWVRALMASRSTMTTLPNGEIVKLNKFAPMGSAVCFPIEALSFWAIAVSAILLHYPHMRLATARKRVWVYGDDIVLHAEDYRIVEAALVKFRLKLNPNKCCTTGSFRESCGVDAYKGIVVTPTRIKTPIPRKWDPTSQGSSYHRRHGQFLLSWSSYSNEFYSKGYERLAMSIAAHLPSSVPITSEGEGGIALVRPDWDIRKANRQRRIKTRFNRRLHRLEAFGWTTSAVVRTVSDDTYEYFFMKFSQWNRTVGTSARLPSGKRRTDQLSVPRRVSSKRGWTQIRF